MKIKISSSGKQVCGCGKGYISAYDAKCGHCRTDKEAYDLAQRHRNGEFDLVKTKPQLVVVYGSQSFTDKARMLEVLNELVVKGILKHDVELVCGMAQGADMTAFHLFKSTENVIHPFHADWTKYGKGAGYRRNNEMAAVADIGVAFWDGKSKGTAQMIQQMLKLSKENHVIAF